ncbi:MAG: tetratricopeptide repeat protein [Candidatus Omnitrophica bacterium]|nr:tetratricopeptide repeat protein [Candidatus Omnitrophota bacterium]
MRIIILLMIFFLTLGMVDVHAASYRGLVPGQSTIEDAEQILGAPVREIQRGRRYDYAPEGHDAKRLSVLYNESTGEIKSISIYVKEAYAREQFVEWLQLEGPAESKRDGEGNLIEEYNGNGIALHFDGIDESEAVKFIRYYQKAGDMNFTDSLQIVPVFQGLRAEKGKFAYLGVQVTGHEGQGIKVLSAMAGSPAQSAGIKSGDIILEAGDAHFYQEDIDVQQFQDVVKDMSVDIPIQFKIQRRGQNYELNITLEEKSREELATAYKKNKQKAAQKYQDGMHAFRDKDYPGAIRSLNFAVIAMPGETRYVRALGDVYLKVGDFKKAIEAYQKALAFGPEYESFLALGAAYTEVKEYDKAVTVLERASRLSEDKEDYRPFEQLALCYYEKRNYEESIGQALKAFRVSKKRAPLACYYLAACFEKMGNIQDAIYYYNRFIKLKPKDEKREVISRVRLKALKNDPEYKRKKEEQRRGWSDMFGKIADEIRGEQSGYGSSTYPPDTGSEGGGTDWDSVFEGSRQQDTSQYDDVFTMPPR